MILLLLACLPKPPPEPLFAPIRRAVLDELHEPVPQPDDCESLDVTRGESLSWAPAGVAPCDGQLVSPSLALELVEYRDLYPKAVAALRAAEDTADLRRTVYEDRLTDERAAREWAERDARVQRRVTPAVGLGGVAVGVALTIAVVAAEQEVRR